MNDLEQIVLFGKETKSIDYKAASVWNEGDKKACCELVKDILAMANIGGGFIVIGVSEVPEGFQWDGLSPDQLESFDTSRINRFLQNYTDPPINCHAPKVAVDGKHFVVIEVPTFADTPHICQKDYPGVLQACALYVRTDNNESAVVKSSNDFRAVIEQAIRKRQDKLLESFRAILTGNALLASPPQTNNFYMGELQQARSNGIQQTKHADANGNDKYVGYKETWCYPIELNKERFDLPTLHRMASNACISYRGWPFLFYMTDPKKAPYAVDGGIEARYKFTDFWGQDRADFWHLGESGLLFQRVLMWEEAYAQKHGTGPLMDFRELAIYIGEGLHCILNLYENVLDPAEPVHIGFKLVGVNGRKLFSANPDVMPLWNDYISHMDNIMYEKTRVMADWRAGFIDHALEVCKYFLLRFNWPTPNLGSCKVAIEKTLNHEL